MDRIPVLFDTDIGNNVDDALALAYLLRNPHCKLLGVTTVSGPVQKRAACAAAICRAAGRDDVPIHCGAAAPLPGGIEQRDVSHFDALAEPERAWPREEPTGVHFLRNAIRGTPQPVVLLSTGPLTNIALLFALDPEVPALLRAFVCMAGVFAPDQQAVESNCRHDPLAAGVVFEQWRRACASGGARVKPCLAVGMDVTRRCTMKTHELRRHMNTPVLETVQRMADPWLRQRESVTFHDPLATACVFRPQLCGYANGTIAVDSTPGSLLAGTTRFAPATNGPHRVATSVNPAVFFRDFFGVFG
jgi:purine nucleosidase